MQSSTTPAPTTPAGAPRTPSPFAPFELLLLAGRHKVLTLGLPLALGALAYGSSLLLPNEYRSNVTIVASDRTPSLLLKNTAESDPVRDAVAERLQLAQRYGVEQGANVAMRYDRRVTTRATRDAGVLVISALDEDPQFAAKLAETVARETMAAAHRQLITASSMVLRKLQGRLQQAERGRATTQDRLAQAGGKDWRDVLSPSEAALMAAVADLQAEINLQGNDPPQSRESSMLLLQERLSTLQQQFTDRNTVRNPATAAVLPILKDQFFYASLTRRLATQIELAQKDMADEIRLAAPPTIPIVKDSPKRSQIAAMAAAIGLVLGLLIAVGRERGGPRMAALRRAWGRQPA